MDEGSYEVDAIGEPDPAAGEVMRRQVDATLRFMAASTVAGLIVIAALAIAVSSIRWVMILVFVVYLFSSVGGYLYLRRTLNERLRRGVPPIE